MSSRTPFVPPDERASGVGATGGLPGANADPRTAELAPEEIESTVAAGDMPGDAAPDPAGDLDADGGEADAEGATQAGLS
jgi:hypothetical protein